MNAIEVRQLRREFPAKGARKRAVALDGVDFRVAEGELHGLLGPNGAGKTTLVRILSTILLPTSGQATVLGEDVVGSASAVRPNIGLVLGGDRGLYTRVSARRNLLFWAALNGVSNREAKVRSAELLDRFGLAERADEPVERFSRGMKQRLHLARGLVHEPKVLFLDEPTGGLDPLATRQLRTIIRQLRDEGRTILLATHDMAEAEILCDRVSLIDRGRMLMSEPTRRVGELLDRGAYVDFVSDRDGLTAGLLALPGVRSVELDEPTGRWRAEAHSADAVGAAVAWLVERGAEEVRMVRPSLEEVYLHLVGDRGMSV